MQPDFSRDARIAPILTRIAQLPKKPRLLVTIDGPCGSGKSTLADALSDALNAPIIRMDDFFLPHALKTPQRLAIPGGNVVVSMCHVCRTVCRRAERAALRADARYGVDSTVLAWLNRLSDYFYLLGRTLTAHYAVDEVLWIP